MSPVPSRGEFGVAGLTNKAYSRARLAHSLHSGSVLTPPGKAIDDLQRALCGTINGNCLFITIINFQPSLNISMQITHRL